MSAKKPAEARMGVEAFLEKNPGASLTRISEECGVSRPTAIKYRDAWLAARDDQDDQGDDVAPANEGKAGGGALHKAYPPAAKQEQPKTPKPEEVKAATPPPGPRRFQLRFRGW